jgi:hypothetical protein
MSGELCEGVDEGVFFFRNPESNGSISPSVVMI